MIGKKVPYTTNLEQLSAFDQGILILMNDDQSFRRNLLDVQNLNKF